MKFEDELKKVKIYLISFFRYKIFYSSQIVFGTNFVNIETKTEQKIKEKLFCETN